MTSSPEATSKMFAEEYPVSPSHLQATPATSAGDTNTNVVSSDEGPPQLPGDNLLDSFPFSAPEEERRNQLSWAMKEEQNASDKLAQMVSELQQSLTNATKELSDLRHKDERCRVHRTLLSSELHTTKEKLREASDGYQAARREKEELAQQLIRLREWPGLGQTPAGPRISDSSGDFLGSNKQQLAWSEALKDAEVQKIKLQDENRRLREQNVHLSATKDELSVELSQIRSDLSSVTDQNAVLKAELQISRNLNTELQTKVVDSETKEAKAADEVRRLKQYESDHTPLPCSEELQKFAALEEQIELLKEAAEMHETVRTRLEEELVKVESQRRVEVEKSCSLRKELLQSARLQKEADDKNRSLSEKLVASERTGLNAQNSLQNEQQRSAATRESLHKSESYITELLSKCAELEDLNAKADARLTEEGTKSVKLMDEIKSLRDQLSCQEIKMSRLRHDVAEGQTEGVKYQQRIVELEATLSAQTGKGETNEAVSLQVALKEENDLLWTQWESARGEITELRTKLNVLGEKMQSILAEGTNIGPGVQEVLSELESIKNVSTESALSLEAQKQQVEELLEKVETLRRERDELKAAVQSQSCNKELLTLQENLRRSEENVLALTRELEELTDLKILRESVKGPGAALTQLKSLKDSVENLEGRIRHEKQNAEAAERERENLKGKLMKTQMENREEIKIREKREATLESRLKLFENSQRLLESQLREEKTKVKEFTQTSKSAEKKSTEASTKLQASQKCLTEAQKRCRELREEIKTLKEEQTKVETHTTTELSFIYGACLVSLCMCGITAIFSYGIASLSC